MATIRPFFRRIIAWGIREETSFEEANYLRMTNGLLLFLFFGSIFETIACFMSGAYAAGLVNSTAPLVFGGGLLLMRTGRTLMARLLVLTLSYLGGYCLAVVLGPEAQVQLLLLFASAFSFTFFPLERAPYLIYGLMLPLGLFGLLEFTQYEPILGLPRTDLSGSQLIVVRVSLVVVIWSLIVGQVIYHIRARRRSQELLVSSAKMVALGQMAAGIAHEVNNPLLLIVAHAERLEALATQGPVAQEPVREIAGKIQKIGMRIGAIVHGLQSLTRDASEDIFVDVPVRSLVDVTLDYCSSRIASHRVELRIPEIPMQLTVIGREAQLSEVLLNVLDNALDATIDLDERWIEIGVRFEKEVVEFTVTDSGRGIPEKLRRKIFDPFFTTKPVGKGTGLGLSVSRRLIASHKGQISYDEAADRTRFIVRVPRGRDRREPYAAVTDPRPASPSS